MLHHSELLITREHARPPNNGNGRHPTTTGTAGREGSGRRGRGGGWLAFLRRDEETDEQEARQQ